MDVTRAQYVEAPDTPSGAGFSVFLAGGITGTEAWQTAAFDMLSDLAVTVLNPRRAAFDLNDDTAFASQVEWEHRYLHEEPYRVQFVLFWFPPSPDPGVQQPISMYELGRLVERGTPMEVGASKDYVRHKDVVKQLALSRPDLTVHPTLEETVAAARRTMFGA
ncbi:nucleoside 2-deoxyribosyltransferase domain-containing protein [Spirillospora sp. CA-253888]